MNEECATAATGPTARFVRTGPSVEARIRATTAEPIVTGAGPVRVGVSVGMSRGAATSSLHAVLSDADRRMYADKRSRRRSPVVAHRHPAVAAATSG